MPDTVCHRHATLGGLYPTVSAGRRVIPPACPVTVEAAGAGTLAFIFATVVALARWGPDGLIPNVTPHALAGREIAESRIEIVDPYIVILVLSAFAATALSGAAVFARRLAVRSAGASGGRRPGSRPRRRRSA
jgi:hypothetical protein